MSDLKNTKVKPKRFKSGRLLLGLFLTVLLLIVALRLIATTELGAQFIENQVNKRSLGQIESVKVSGLSGDPFGRFSVQSLEIKDKQGTWAEARDIVVDWKPLSLIRGPILIHNIDLASLDIARKPVLNSKSKKDSADGFKGVVLSRAAIEKLILQEPVAGQAAVFNADGKFVLSQGGKIQTNAKLFRTDQEGDSLDFNMTRAATGAISGEFRINGAASGPLANLLRAPPDTSVGGQGTVNGDLVEGAGNLSIDIGDRKAIDVKLLWADGLGVADATIVLDGWPAVDRLSERIGQTLTVKSTFGFGSDNPQFEILATSPVLEINLSGLREAHQFMPDTAHLSANIRQVGVLANLPPGFQVGSATADGTIQLSSPTKFDGSLTLRTISTPHGRAKSVQGPMSVIQSSATQFDFTVDMKVDAIRMAQPLPFSIAEKTNIKAKGRYDIDTQNLFIDTYRFTTAANKVTGAAKLSVRASSFGITGRGELDIIPIGALPSGDWVGDFNLSKQANAALVIDSDGRFAPASLPFPLLTDIVGKEIFYQTKISVFTGDFDIKNLDLSSDGFKATLHGLISDRLDLNGEAVLLNPLIASDLSVSGPTDMSFQVSGERQSPILRIDANSLSARFQNVEFTAPRLRSQLSGENGTLQGTIQIDAGTKHGELLATSGIKVQNSAISADDFNIQIGRLAANGSLKIDSNALVTGTLKLDLPEKDGQYARLSLGLSQRDGQQAVKLEADARQIAIGGIEIDSFTATADGALDGLVGNIETEGHRGSKIDSPAFDLSMPFQIVRTGNGVTSIESNYSGQYNNIGFTSESESRLMFDQGTLSLVMPLRIADGTIELKVSRSQHDDTLSATISDIPVSLLRMPGNLGDTRGRISGKLDFTSGPQFPTGTGNLALNDWRGFDVKKGNGLNTKIVFELGNHSLSWALHSDARNGFQATSSGNIPTLHNRLLSDIRLDLKAPLSGNFNASGPAATLIGLVTPSDSELAGELSTTFTLTGTALAPLLKGSANGNGIAFEVPELGTQIRNANFEALLLNEKLEITNVSASDPNGGKLDASGSFSFGELARPLGTLSIEASNFKALDRRDVFAWVSGKLAYTSAANSRTLSGDILIDKAEVREFVTGAVGVIEIDVEEINRPNDRSNKSVRKPDLPIKLAIQVVAPRNVFIRSRGLDVEMSVDANLKGTLTDPEFYGHSAIVRGGYKLAGKNLNFQNGSIKFDGPLSEATVKLKAETVTQNITAEILISGSIENPVIDLSSSPDRPKDEILSTLLFGKSVTELSVFETAQLASALAQFSGVGTGMDLLGGIRSSLGLSQLNVDYDPSNGTKITGGRYLAKNVYLQLFSGSGLDQTGAIIDWEIRKNLALRSRIQSDYNQSLSLKWKKDF